MHPNDSRILIVDDASAVRESLAWLIEDEEGLTNIGTASTGSEAITQTVKLIPDLVILDVELPDADGFVITRQIKAMADPPLVVLLSVHDDEASRQHGMEAGCDAYVEKGSGWSRLLNVMRELLGKKKNL